MKQFLKAPGKKEPLSTFFPFLQEKKMNNPITSSPTAGMGFHPQLILPL